MILSQTQAHKLMDIVAVKNVPFVHSGVGALAELIQPLVCLRGAKTANQPAM